MNEKQRFLSFKAFWLGETMEKRLKKSGLRLSTGLLGLLMLFGTDNSYAISSFKNTPLYKHIIKRRNAEPVRLYEKEPISPGKQEEIAGKSSDEKIEVDEKTRDAKETRDVDLERAGRTPAAQRSMANLMDPSAFEPDMPFSEAIDILRNSTFPKLNIVVLWKDLEENADIYPDTPIGIDGVTGVSLNRHLKSLLDGVAGGAQEKLGYVVDEGVVVISTLGNLPKKMVTRIYDITDLVGQPANYGGMQGIMMSRIVGMMSGGGMMGGGMMGGLGGRYGNIGGGYNANPGLTGSVSTQYRPFR